MTDTKQKKIGLNIIAKEIVIKKSFANLRKRQREAAIKAKAQGLFFLLAKCRFGKTPTAINIMSEQWRCKTALVISGIAVREGWSKDLISWGDYDIVIKTNKELMEFVSKIAEDPNYASDKNVAIFVMTQKLCRDYADAIDADDTMILAGWFNARLGNKVIAFDEAHFAEQAALTSTILNCFNPTHKIYITATGWTKSLKQKITVDNSFNYGLKEEYADYCKGELDYKYIKLYMYCLDKTVHITDDTEEAWNKLWKSPREAKDVLTRALSNITEVVDTKHGETKHNIILYVRTKEEGALVLKYLSEIKVAGYNIYSKSAVGNCAITQTDASAFYNEHTAINDINVIVSCNRLGTGTTIPELNITMFCCPTKSAIKFVQYSMRGISQLDDNSKDKAYVFCFNRFGAYEIYSKLSRDLEDKKKKHFNKGNFKDMQGILPFYVETDSGLKEVEFIDIAQYNEQYAKGQKLFGEFDSMESFEGFNIFVARAKQAKAKVRQEAENQGMTKEETDELIDKLERAETSADVKAAVDEVNKKLDPTGKKKILTTEDREALDIEKTRKLLQETFIDNIEAAVLDGVVVLDDERQAVYTDDDLFTEYFRENFTRELFDTIISEYADYVSKIANTIYSRVRID